MNNAIDWKCNYFHHPLSSPSSVPSSSCGCRGSKSSISIRGPSPSVYMRANAWFTLGFLTSGFEAERVRVALLCQEERRSNKHTITSSCRKYTNTQAHTCFHTHTCLHTHTYNHNLRLGRDLRGDERLLLLLVLIRAGARGDHVLHLLALPRLLLC